MKTGKRSIVVGILLGLAMLPFAAQALSPAEVDHLMQRAAFAAAPGDYQRMSTLSREQAVDLLLKEARDDSNAPAVPDWANPTPPWTIAYWQHESDAEKMSAMDRRVEGRRYAAAARHWYLNQLLNARSPLRARMALHWHEFYPSVRGKHAAVAIQRDARFYQLAIGDYRELLAMFSRNGITMETLDMRRNRRGAINENFGRELLELYGLGKGHYSENDIREAARAFSGWWFDYPSQTFFVMWQRHDFGNKTVLGHTGRFDGDDVLDLIVQHPRFAEYQVERLWTSFISPTPDGKKVRQWAARFRQENFALSPLLRTMLTSEEFWAAENRQSLVRSPAELVIGSLRGEGITGDYGEWADLWATQMGQTLYAAPDVKGWRGHTDWLTIRTIGMRQAYLNGMAQGFEPSVLSRFDAASFQFYPQERIYADSARLWQAVETSRNTRARQASTAMMAMSSGERSAADPMRNLK